MKMLIVEDDLTSKLILQSFLKPLGDIDVSETGDFAMRQFTLALQSGHPYELICLDITLPGGMNGITVLKNMRALESKYDMLKPSKILMTTSNSKKEVLTESIRSHCNGYLLKPFDKDALNKQLETCGLKGSY